MDLHSRVAKLEQANRRWKLLFTAAIGVLPVLLIAGGMSSKISKNQGIADEIRTRTLVVVDDKGDVIGSFDANGLTMQHDEHVTKVGPSGIRIASHQESSVRITGDFIRLSGFDAEKKQRFEELREQLRHDDLTEEESRKIRVEMGKHYYERPLVSLSYFPDSQSGYIRLTDLKGRGHQITASE